MTALSYWQQLDLLTSQWKESHPSPSELRKRVNAAKKQNTQAQREKERAERTQIEPIAWEIASDLQCSVTFPVGHSHKRFVRGLSAESKLSDRGRQYLAYIAHRYRRQWKPSKEEFEWIVKWGSWVEVK